MKRDKTMFITQIQVKGKINPNWSDWFEEMQIRESFSGDTILCGNLPDQAAVYGVLSRLSSLGIPLISVTCQEKCDTGPPVPGI
jgi:hypothetical protein